MERDLVKPTNISKALKLIHDGLVKQLGNKGYGSFVSLHEIDGVLDEEVHEFKREVHANDIPKSKEELIDIAVAAVWGIACIENETINK